MYFAQNQASLLNENATIFETIDDIAVGDVRTKIKDILGAFMFHGDDVTKSPFRRRENTFSNDKTIVRTS
jgi:ATPase subunit of ABC transporter with duplicated ATPase domains